jgi:hypothetical protein
MRTGGYPEDWDERRRQVLERDGYACQRCGATDRSLHVHHVTPISEGGSHDLTNLETLCERCHADEHPVQTTLQQAVARNRRVRMKYSSNSGTRVRELDPYAVTMHEGIQYVVGHDSYRDDIRHFRPTRIEWVELTDGSFTAPAGFDADAYLSKALDSRGQSSGCFIATAAYGTPTAADLDVLREFRDEVLLESSIGRVAVWLYYRLSPPIAAWIARRERRRRLVRTWLVEPAVRILTD